MKATKNFQQCLEELAGRMLNAPSEQTKRRCWVIVDNMCKFVTIVFSH